MKIKSGEKPLDVLRALLQETHSLALDAVQKGAARVHSRAYLASRLRRRFRDIGEVLTALDAGGSVATSTEQASE